MEVNHESFTRGWQCTGTIQTPPMEPRKCNSVQEALSNSLILKEIFTFLDAGDLESCFHVCQDWRSAADRFDFAHYDIKIERSHYHRYAIFVGERDRYNPKIFTQRTDLAGFTQLLKVLLNQKVSIGLTISAFDFRDNNKIMDLISKIRPLVLNLDIRCLTMDVVAVSKLLLHKFPNLKKLNCSSFHYRPEELARCSENQRFHIDLLENKHKQLRKISFEGKNCCYPCIKTILKIFPNLVEIEDFPLRMINAIVVAQKGPALKSLYGMDHSFEKFHQNGETVVTAHRKLAELQPKLTSLEITRKRFLKYPRNTFEMVKPYLFSVLQSSHESLESLLISPVRSDEIQNFPPLAGLKELVLIQGDSEDEGFFPRLAEIFPNVSKIRMKNAGSTLNLASVNGYFQKNIPYMYRDQINLSIEYLDEKGMAMMGRLFPFTQNLQMKCICENLAQSLGQLSIFLPQLKSLTIYVWFGWRGIQPQPFRLDSAFTGLPGRIIDQLEDPAKKKNFTQEQIQEFKDRSIICKLKELKELKLILRDNDTYVRLSPVANEFGFNLVPELKVTVDTQTMVCFAKAKMWTDLEKLGLCSNIEIVDDWLRMGNRKK